MTAGATTLEISTDEAFLWDSTTDQKTLAGINPEWYQENITAAGIQSISIKIPASTETIRKDFGGVYTGYNGYSSAGQELRPVNITCDQVFVDFSAATNLKTIGLQAFFQVSGLKIGTFNFFLFYGHCPKEETCVIADGAAIGPEMNRLYNQVKVKSNVKLYLPESFEWIILQSGIVDEKEIRTILLEPEQYIDSKDYFSWEQYFAKLLIRCTENTYLQYRKSKLNETYLHEKNKKMILESIKGIKF